MRELLGDQCGPERHVPSREGLSEAHDISVRDVGVTVGVGVAVGVASHVFLAVTVGAAVPHRQ